MSNPNSPQNPQVSKNGGFISLIEGLIGVYIEQRPDIIDCILPCDFKPNQYKIYPLTNGQKEEQEVLICNEKNGCIIRNIFPLPCRPLELDIEKDGNVVMTFTKSCTLTCYCIMRPKIEVRNKENGRNQLLGYIIDKFDFCGFNQTFEIYNQNDSLIHTIKGNCCQIGLLCNCPCAWCEKFEFDLNDLNGSPIGKIQKLGTGSCFDNCCSTADHFSIPFPGNANWQTKALLIAAGLWIDFSMFERKINRGKST